MQKTLKTDPPTNCHFCTEPVTTGSADRVEILFDWQIPSREAVTFQVQISRHGQQSIIDFVIDLEKLSRADLETLHDFLSLRPRGYWLVRAITALLDISLKQQMPELDVQERHKRVRELL